jgi:uncharacterized protein YndB with AHSA1/START domain
MRSTEVGRTKDVGWEIGVSRTVSCSPEQAWQVLLGDGLAIWLGRVDDLELERGAPYRTAEGASGELRSFRPRDRIRLTLRPAGDDHESTVQIVTTAAPSSTAERPRTSIRFHQERLRDAEERERQRAHWAAVIDELTPLFEAG